MLNTEDFKIALEEWRNDSSTPKSARKKARELLQNIEEAISLKKLDTIPDKNWHDFLNITGRPHFLKSLGNVDFRYRWADATAKIVEHSDYRMLDMLTQRAEEIPEKTLFQDMGDQNPTRWNYKVSFANIKAIAALFYKLRAGKSDPRVAIFADNSVEGAWCDIACLSYDILVTPLNVHFDVDTLVYIIDKLSINIVAVNSSDGLSRLTEVRSKAKNKFKILTMKPYVEESGKNGNLLENAYSIGSSDAVDRILENRNKFRMTEVCTVMFTSGSTGVPKGISFSQFNLVSKRFARSAALPDVGNDEALLCYLPLYHTFGRYFEMLGTIYWKGTYVFPGNASVATLLSLLKEISPTGLISIPLRWVQIQEKCNEKIETGMKKEVQEELVRQIIGKRLHWGLSAAGYLAPSVFKFFNMHGVKLCSGFGMTEATGGITMTPPGEYVDNSIGKPLPLVDIKLTDESEMLISGAYIARYFDEIGLGDDIPIEMDSENKYWLPSGDIFKQIDKGHYEIVDRLKDIYKNNKGQTIAPQKVEKKFEEVPGIKKTFLVGDAREYNVLLIIPDNDDPVLHGISDKEGLREYYHQIVSNANQDLANYERVVNFDLLNREFSADKDELTPKGSFKRKNIEKNFKDTIDLLYKSQKVEIKCGKYKLVIPRWIFRDLGNLEDVITAKRNSLKNRVTGKSLSIKETKKTGQVQIGDLVYEMDGDIINLGSMARQPALWIGNPELINFVPCREGWDISAPEFSRRVLLPKERKEPVGSCDRSSLSSIKDQALSIVNQLAARALFASSDRAEHAIENLGHTLSESDDRVKRVIRRRLEGLAYHDNFKIRSTAYRVLLLDEPTRNYALVFPTFVESGLPFLDEDSIHKIASRDLKKRRLEALRLRLFSYRTQYKWPVRKEIRHQFVQLLKLLADFARYHPEYYDMVRCELASWILLTADRKIAKEAEKFLTDLYQDYESNLSESSKKHSETEWESKVVFGDELGEREIIRIKEVLFETTFLKQSIVLGFDDDEFDLDKVPQGGIWISRILSRRRNLRYRVSVNAYAGKHYDLQIILGRDISKKPVLETIYWLMSLSSYPYGPRIMPRLGCVRLELGARSLVYHGDLTVWEKIREYTGNQYSPSSGSSKTIWRKLFIRSLATIFKGWRIAGGKLVPGAVTPENIIVPIQDFREGAVIQSLTGWKHYENTLSLIQPIVQNFYRKTISHYPACLDLIETNWIFDACIEELGLTDGRLFLENLKEDLTVETLPFDHCRFVRELDKYLARLSTEYYAPLQLKNAINRYNEWADLNQDSTSKAKEQIINELYRLYRLDRMPEIAHYYMYRHTYFKGSSKTIRKAFDCLLDAMFNHQETSALQMIELSDLQATLKKAHDREAFGQMIFPKLGRKQNVEIFAVGDAKHKHVVVKTTIIDDYGEKYIIREPIEPAEIGKLYRLFFKEGYPKTVNEGDRFLIVINSNDQVIGGLCYRHDGDDIVHLDGSVITGLLSGRGIGGALLEDFCTRMTNQEIAIIKTHFFLRRFYAKHGFKIDNRWGALVRFLDPEASVEAQDKEI